MSDLGTSAVAGGAAAAQTAAMSGWATQEVLLAAFIGGLVSVWLSRQAAELVTFTWRWVAGALAQVGVSTAAGVALSALLQAIAPAYALTAPLANVPPWVLAGVIAAVAIKAGPVAFGAIKRLAGVKEGGGDA